MSDPAFSACDVVVSPSDASLQQPPRKRTHDSDEREEDCGEDAHTGSSVEQSPSDEKANNSLITQSLNSDGTPRRPMNAFMIFARRRRPQVSAENTAMRTGEISKLLSKEWNAMPKSNKQFYLDQARRLKDNFNSKYPDYVYKRRPNNSRKRRRPDAMASESSMNEDFDSSSGGLTFGPDGDDSQSPTDFEGHDNGTPESLDTRNIYPRQARPYSEFSHPKTASLDQPPPLAAPFSYDGQFPLYPNPHNHSTTLETNGNSQSPQLNPLFHNRPQRNDSSGDWTDGRAKQSAIAEQAMSQLQPWESSASSTLPKLESYSPTFSHNPLPPPATTSWTPSQHSPTEATSSSPSLSHPSFIPPQSSFPSFTTLTSPFHPTGPGQQPAIERSNSSPTVAHNTALHRHPLHLQTSASSRQSPVVQPNTQVMYGDYDNVGQSPTSANDHTPVMSPMVDYGFEESRRPATDHQQHYTFHDGKPHRFHERGHSASSMSNAPLHQQSSSGFSVSEPRSAHAYPRGAIHHLQQHESDRPQALTPIPIVPLGGMPATAAYLNHRQMMDMSEAQLDHSAGRHQHHPLQHVQDLPSFDNHNASMHQTPTSHAGHGELPTALARSHISQNFWDVPYPA